MAPCLGAHRGWPGLAAGTDRTKRRGMKATSVRAGPVMPPARGSQLFRRRAWSTWPMRAAEEAGRTARRRLGRPAGAVQAFWAGGDPRHAARACLGDRPIEPMDFRAGVDGLAAACAKRLAGPPLGSALSSESPGGPTSSRRAGRPTSRFSTPGPAACEQRFTATKVRSGH